MYCDIVKKKEVIKHKVVQNLNALSNVRFHVASEERLEGPGKANFNMNSADVDSERGVDLNTEQPTQLDFKSLSSHKSDC